MDKTVCSLTVLFESPFWIGIYERCSGGRYEVSKIVFGAEPTDPQVYAFFSENWGRLAFSPPQPVEKRAEKTVNPKRMRRIAARATQPAHAGTKAQQAVQLLREQHKHRRSKQSREEREAQARRRYAQRKEKQREKHKGR